MEIGDHPMSIDFSINIYFMKTYVLLHFEHKNDVTIIVELLLKGKNGR